MGSFCSCKAMGVNMSPWVNYKNKGQLKKMKKMEECVQEIEIKTGHFARAISWG